MYIIVYDLHRFMINYSVEFWVNFIFNFMSMLKLILDELGVKEIS